MLNNDCIEELTGLKDIIVDDVKNVYGQQHIYLHMSKRIHICPVCGEKTSKVHDYRTQTIKDISSYGQMTYLHLRKRRHVCPVCGKRFYEEVDFLPRYHRMTNRLAAYMMDQFADIQSMKQIGKIAKASGQTVTKIFDSISYPKPLTPEVLSIDESRGDSGDEKFYAY